MKEMGIEKQIEFMELCVNSYLSPYFRKRFEAVIESLKTLQEVKALAAHTDTEATAFPAWVIVDGNRTHNGVWFCRERAEAWLKDNRHNFSDKAYVFCRANRYSDIEALYKLLGVGL